jgi:hypothetical protein
MGRLLFLAKDFRVRVRDGDADKFLVGVEPEVPVCALGLHQEVAKTLGTSVHGRVVISLELDKNLG